MKLPVNFVLKNIVNVYLFLFGNWKNCYTVSKMTMVHRVEGLLDERLQLSEAVTMLYFELENCV